MCHNGASSLLSRKPTQGKKRAAICLMLTHFCLQFNLVSFGISDWYVASTCPQSHDKGFCSQVDNFSCLIHFRFPHLPVKISFYTGGSLHIDQHKEKRVREKREEHQCIFTKHLLSATVLYTHWLIFSTTYKIVQPSTKYKGGKVERKSGLCPLPQNGKSGK